MQLEEVQKRLINDFNFKELLNDLNDNLPDAAVVFNNEIDLKEFAERAIKYVFEDKHNVTISLTCSYLEGKKTITDEELIFTLKSNLDSCSIQRIKVDRDLDA